MAGFFSEVFRVDPQTMDDYGCVDISLVADVPLFVDPFLLFHSDSPDYQNLHRQIVKYIGFLKDKSDQGKISDGLLKSWYCFSEVRQNWLGYAELGNDGRGLGMEFARSLNSSLGILFGENSGAPVTQGIHLEKVCLIQKGVGKDNISDFTTNLIKSYLAEYTEKFAALHIDGSLVRCVPVQRAIFDYELESWVTKSFNLPSVNGDYILLTPKDILTKDENWINQSDMVDKFKMIPSAIPNFALRAQVENYFDKKIREKTRKAPTSEERRVAILDTLKEFPFLVDYYISLKENDGDSASKVSNERVIFAQILFRNAVKELTKALPKDFFDIPPLGSLEEARQRLMYLKHVIEDQGGHRIFVVGGKPIRRESDLHVLYRLVWYGTKFDFGAEANDGRGPVDFKVSFGAKDKSLVEFKLASNTQLESNLKKQLELYKIASDAQHGIKAIVYFSIPEWQRVQRILKRLKMDNDKNIVLIDARPDNKPSASRAR